MEEKETSRVSRVPNPLHLGWSVVIGYAALFLFLVIARDLSLSQAVVTIGFIVAFAFIFSCFAFMVSFLPRPKPTQIFINCQVCWKPIRWWQRKVLVSTMAFVGSSQAEKAWYRHRKCRSNIFHEEDTPDIMMQSLCLEKVWSHRDEIPFDVYGKLCEEISDTEVSGGLTKLGRVRHRGAWTG